VTRLIRFAFRNILAVAIALPLAPATALAESIAASGPCAVAPEREPCAGGACSSETSNVRNRFAPLDVGANDTGDDRDASAPVAPDFSGPGSCADPSAGCGSPSTIPSLARNTVPAPSPSAIGAPPAAPIVPNPSETPIPAAPPGPPAAGAINSPPTSAPPVVPVAANLPPPPAPTPIAAPPAISLPPPAAPPAPPAATPPAPPPPPTVTEPPPAPILPPGVPQP
jgi:hypothetical protein